MYLRSALAWGALALGANAMLVVPEMEADALPRPGFSELQPLEAHTAQHQQVDLHCTECPFREVTDEGKVHWTTGGQETTLTLNFTVEDGLLLANGRQIFPPPPPTHITAVQHRLSDGDESVPIPLGYAVEMMPLPSPPEEPMGLVAVRFTVLDLDSHPVPLNTVAIHLIHDPEGGLYMAKTEIEDNTPNQMSWKQCRGQPNCLRKLLFNRIRALFASAKARMLAMVPKKGGCGGRLKGMGHHHPPPFPPMGDESAWEEMGPMGPHGRPHPHPHHHMHPMHHSPWERTFSRVVRFIVIPAVLGVLAGLAASALGMLVGQVAIFFWRRCYRHSARAESEEQGTATEKQGLMAEGNEMPPAYADDEGLPEHVAAEKN